MSTASAGFVYDVEAIEIALFFNSIAWVRYFGYPRYLMDRLPFYMAMDHIMKAEWWYTCALILCVLQAATFMARRYTARRLMFAVYAMCTLFVQWSIWHIPIIVLNEYQNLGLIIACVYAFARLAIRHRTVRVA